MGVNKESDGYASFDYLSPGEDFEIFELTEEVDRVPAAPVPLEPRQEERAARLAEDCVMISFHEHLDRKTADITDMPAYTRQGRMATAFRALETSQWDAVFDNLMDGHCNIHSEHGWKWTEILQDLGMRLCDLAHQDFLVPCTDTATIVRAHDEGKIAWIASIEGAAMIENELDRIEVLYGFGVRCLGVTYSEANALGSGLMEPGDGGLTMFGRRAVERMNKVGMLIDCSHAGDRTTLDVIEVSEQPVVLTHIGARALWNTLRMAPDEVLVACAEKGGVIGIEAAPHTTVSPVHPRHCLDSVMDHFEYVRDLVGIDHVTFGPDTTFGDHVASHRFYAGQLAIERAARPLNGSPPGFAEVDYVRGIENPAEGSHNILRWLVREGYSDEAIEKVLGGNVMRVLDEVWQ